MFKKIEHVAFFIKDSIISKEFYQNHFGFEVQMELDHPAPNFNKIIFMALGGTELELIETTEPPKISGGHICIGTDSFDEDFKRLTDNGLKVIQAPVHASAGRKRAIFQGPDGEEIEIIG